MKTNFLPVFVAPASRTSSPFRDSASSTMRKDLSSVVRSESLTWSSDNGTGCSCRLDEPEIDRKNESSVHPAVATSSAPAHRIPRERDMAPPLLSDPDLA